MGLFKSVKKALGGGDKKAEAEAAAAAAAQAAAAERVRLSQAVQKTQTGDVDAMELQRRMLEMQKLRGGRAAASLIGQGGDPSYSRDRLG